MPQQISESPNQSDSPGQLATVSNSSITTISVSDRDRETERYQELIAIQQQQIDRLVEEIEILKRNAVAPNKYARFWHNLKAFIAKLNGSADFQPRFSLDQILFSYIGSFLGIATLAYLSIGSGYPLIAAPFGAAAVLVFAVPNAPLAQPRNLIFGNFIGAVVSVFMVFLFGSEPWVMALAVATAIKLMQLTKTLHPPGGAVALVGVMSKAQLSFIFTPVLVGSIILLLCTFVFNNLIPGRSYPKHWF
jgi:CBS-domain-containing membrane protein